MAASSHRRPGTTFSFLSVKRERLALFHTAINRAGWRRAQGKVTKGPKVRCPVRQQPCICSRSRQTSRSGDAPGNSGGSPKLRLRLCMCLTARASQSQSPVAAPRSVRRLLTTVFTSISIVSCLSAFLPLLFTVRARRAAQDKAARNYSGPTAGLSDRRTHAFRRHRAD